MTKIYIKSVRKIYFPLLCSLILFGCIKPEEIPTKFAPGTLNAGLPLADDSLSMNEILTKVPNFKLILDPTGVYKFSFTPDRFKFPTAESAIVLNDLQLVGSNAPANEASFPVADLATPITKSYVLSVTGAGTGEQLKGATIHKIYYKGGTLNIAAKTSYSKSVTLTIKVKSLKLKTDPTKSAEVNITVINDDKQVSGIVDLKDYFLSLDTKNNDGVGDNEIEIEISALAEAGGTPGDIFITSFYFEAQKWEKINASFGDNTFPLATNISQDLSFGTVVINPFSNNENDNTFSDVIDFYFENPSFTGTVYSSYGISGANFLIKPIHAISKSGRILNTIEPVDQALPKYVESLRALGTTSFSIVPTDINSVMKRGPKELRYSIYLKTVAPKDQQELKSRVLDFILDTSTVAADMKLELPLYGFFKLFNLESETLNPLFGISDQAGVTTAGVSLSVDEAFLKLGFKNNFPFQIKLQVYLLDANKVKLRNNDGSPFVLLKGAGVLDSTGIEIKPAPVGVNGETTEFAEGVYPITLSISDFDRIKSQAKYIKFAAQMYSTDGVNGVNAESKKLIKITPKNKILVRLGGALSGSFNVSQGN